MNASQLNERMARIHAREHAANRAPLYGLIDDGHDDDDASRVLFADVWNVLAWAVILAGPAWFLVLLAIHYLRR